MPFHVSEPQFSYLQNGHDNAYLRSPGGDVAVLLFRARSLACGELVVRAALAVADGEWVQAASGSGVPGTWHLNSVGLP